MCRKVRTIHQSTKLCLKRFLEVRGHHQAHQETIQWLCLYLNLALKFKSGIWSKITFSQQGENFNDSQKFSWTSLETMLLLGRQTHKYSSWMLNDSNSSSMHILREILRLHFGVQMSITYSSYVRKALIFTVSISMNSLKLMTKIVCLIFWNQRWFHWKFLNLILKWIH